MFDLRRARELTKAPTNLISTTIAESKSVV